ncbi:S8 family serine peptidase [Paenibacillus glufosinatiresistens]|uniref:S8 family serine peptidase n=1 Tax=Paenibacillus glufosinatiresistens TaxID=3070657 RepID=UPI00286DC96B|nr:S8 family serine peptidase [Paenibacillus sp. YX.27]
MPEQVNLCIIDDGVNAELLSMGPLTFNKEVTAKGCRVIERAKGDPPVLSHGTVCAGIINLYAPSARLSSIKILQAGSDPTGSVNQLIAALYWCAEHDIRIANLSLGSTCYRDFEPITRCINEVTAKGLIVIAAGHNNQLFTMPASLTNVIGVKSAKLPASTYQFDPYPMDGQEVRTSGEHTLIDRGGKKIETQNYNSFAAPYISGLVYHMIGENPHYRVEEVKKELHDRAEESVPKAYNPFLCVNRDWMSVKSAAPREKKIWDEPLYVEQLTRWMNEGECQGSCEIPVLSIVGARDTEWIGQLGELFCDDGYFAKWVTPYPQQGYSSAEYLPPGTDPGRYFQLLVKKYGCDLILYDNRLSSGPLSSYDYDVVVDLSAVPVRINGRPVKGGMKKIYRHLLGILTD